MKSPVKEKILRILLDGASHSEIELARGAGFTRASTIQKWTRGFESAKFISRTPAGSSGDYACQVRQTREIARKIYNYAEFRRLRPQIRDAPWFSSLFTRGFGGLPGDLPVMVSEMVKKSHTFFEIIDRYDSPEKVREIYQPALFLNEVFQIRDEEINSLCLYYQVYLHAVIRDISGGGLGDGFMDPVEDIQQRIRAMKVVPGGVHRAR